jgi:ankyrin repeat protein
MSSKNRPSVQTTQPPKAQQKAQTQPKPKPIELTPDDLEWIRLTYDTTNPATGDTPLHRALLRRETLYALDIILSGGDIHAVNFKGETPLHLAVQLPERNGVVQMLVLDGCDVHALTDQKRTPLFYAHPDHIPYLLKKGTVLDAVDSEGLTPFLCAVQAGDVLRASCLLNMTRVGTLDVSTRDRAFAIAKANGDKDMESLLWFRL